MKWPTRDSLRKSIIQIQHEFTQEALKRFRSGEYVAVAVDEGSTLGTKYVNFVLHDVASYAGEFCLHSECLDGTGTAEEYVDPLLKGFEYVMRENLMVGSIVVDGNKAQLKALGSGPGMLRARLGDQGRSGQLSRYIIVPCACHKLNNSYKHLVAASTAISSFTQALRDLGKEINDSREPDLPSCQTFVSTRWLYDADIIAYIEKHQNQVELFCAKNSKQFPFADVTHYGPLITMLRSVVTQFEQSDYPLASVWPRIYTLCLDLKTRSRSVPKTARKPYLILINILKDELLQEGKYLLAYLLTPNGRTWFRQTQRLKAKPVENQYSWKTKDHDDIVTNLDYEIDIIIQDKKNEPEKLIGTNEIPEKVSISSLTANWRTKAMDAINEIAAMIFPDKESQKRARNSFALFIEGVCTPFDEPFVPLAGRNLFNWDTLKETRPYQELADIALRMRPAPASEASAERTISIQRLVVVARRNRAKSGLVNARMSLMRAIPMSEKPRKRLDSDAIDDMARIASIVSPAPP